MNETIKLWRKCEDGVVRMRELSRGMFSDADSFQSAIDQAYEDGCCDTWEEAQES